VVPEAVDNYKKGDSVEVDMTKGTITIAGKVFTFKLFPKADEHF